MESSRILTKLTGKTYLAQEFVKIKSWLHLVFSTYLYNQLRFIYEVL